MRRLLKWIGITLGSVVVLAVIAYGVLYIISEHMLRRTYAFAPIPLQVPTDADSVAKGKRLAKLYGCSEGCHGKGIEGDVMVDSPLVARVVAPNLTSAVRRYSDPELAAIIRTGVRPDGRSVFVMPSQALRLISDEELGDILAYLRSVPAVDGPRLEGRVGPLVRLNIVTGSVKTTAQLVQEAVPPPPASGEGAQRGRYLASTTCAGCHGTDLSGGHLYDGPPTPPPLQIVAAYSPEAFTELMRNGIALGGRKLGIVMRDYVALGRMSVLTQAQIADLYSYLHELPVPPAMRQP